VLEGAEGGAAAAAVVVPPVAGGAGPPYPWAAANAGRRNRVSDFVNMSKSCRREKIRRDDRLLQHIDIKYSRRL